MKGVTYSTPLMALQVVQGYVSLCLPNSIEAEVNVAVNKAHFAKTDSDTGGAAPAPAPAPPPPPAPAVAAIPPVPPRPVGARDVMPSMTQDQTH
jgi:hypothetical protein